MMKKSHIFSSGVSPEIKDRIQRHLQLLEGRLPVRYLGVEQITTKLSLVHPYLRRLSKECLLGPLDTYAGRLQLLISVLFHLQVFLSRSC